MSAYAHSRITYPTRHPPPQVYGLLTVKLAALLTIIGGVARSDDTGGHIRGEVHCLLVGDPGTGAGSGVAAQCLAYMLVLAMLLRCCG